MPKHPDRSHLADAIQFMDLIDLADEELPAARATIEQAKKAAVTARNELDKHQQWLGRHQDLYTEAVKGCERRLKRQAFIAACKDTARLPIQLLSTAWNGLFNAGHRRSLRAKLKDRLQELDHPSQVKAGQHLQQRIQAMDGRDLR
jgi:hypothetical protein